MERTHTLIFRQRQDTDKERKSDRGFSQEDGGACSRIIELHTAGSYTHTGGCWGLAGIYPVILPGTTFARFGWICSDCKSSILSHNKIYILTATLVFRSWVFPRVSIPKIIVSILRFISQFYIPLHIVKDIHVWLSVDILHALFSPSWILKENLYGIRALVS